MAGGISITSRLTVRSNTISKIRSQIIEQMKGAVDDTAALIEERAKQIAPVDTGALQSSIYHNNGVDSDYDTNIARARSQNKDAVILDEIDPEFVIPLSGSNEDSYTQVVGCAVEYGIFNEYGTRHMRPHPFMLPSALGAEDDFTTAMTQIAD